LFLKTVFGEEHIYGRSMDDKDYLEIKRDALIDFYKNNYSNLDAFIIAAGPIDSSVIKSIDDSLGTLKSLIGATQTEVYSSNMQVQAKKVFVEKQGSVQAALYLGKELFNRQHSDFQPMMVVNTILGGYFGSRLMKKIREEKGYTYGINSALVSHLYGGYFVIQTEVINDLKAQALDEIYKEIETLRNETIPQEEFNLVKNYMIGHLMRSFDNAFAKTERLKTIIEYGLEKEYYSNFVNKILNMKAFEINELAQKYINEQHFCEIVVGA
jgi:predicted Zn-dependent peptidase